MTTAERIRSIFLFPKAAYALSETAELLEYSEAEIIAAVDSGDLEVLRENALPRVAWAEVVLTAIEKWPQELIEDSLGSDVPAVMPELVRLTELRVRVPRYSVVAASRIALREGTTIDHIVSRQLLDLAVSESTGHANSVADLSTAIRWPLA